MRISFSYGMMFLMKYIVIHKYNDTACHYDQHNMSYEIRCKL